MADIRVVRAAAERSDACLRGDVSRTTAIGCMLAGGRAFGSQQIDRVPGWRAVSGPPASFNCQRPIQACQGR